MRILAVSLLLMLLPACSTVKEMERRGFTTDQLLKLEQEDWGEPKGVWDWKTRADYMKVPLDARPLAIRDLRCKHDSFDLYSCDYLIDYGRNGRVEGTYQKRDELIGKDKGHWSIGWIVVD